MIKVASGIFVQKSAAGYHFEDEGPVAGGPKDIKSLPYRDRVELYAVNPKGKLYGGTWEVDKSFSVPGGGIDPGETPEMAAVREAKEEAGLIAINPKLAPIAPVTFEYDKPINKGGVLYRGGRTYFVTADLVRRVRQKKLDVWSAQNRGYYSPEDAVKIMKANTNYMSPETAAARTAVLQHLVDRQKR